MIRRERARTFFSRRKLKECVSGQKYNYRPWVSDRVSKATVDNFCDSGDIDFLKLSRLLSTFDKQDHAMNAEALLNRAHLLRG